MLGGEGVSFFFEVGFKIPPLLEVLMALGESEMQIPVALRGWL